jgi:hypothetical protein
MNLNNYSSPTQYIFHTKIQVAFLLWTNEPIFSKARQEAWWNYIDLRDGLEEGTTKEKYWADKNSQQLNMYKTKET